jgi:hypothetical protein
MPLQVTALYLNRDERKSLSRYERQIVTHDKDDERREDENDTSPESPVAMSALPVRALMLVADAVNRLRLDR